MTVLGREPAVWIGIIVSCIFAVVGVLSGEGLINDALNSQITDGVNAVAQLLVLLAPVITGIVIRGRVTPVAAPAVPQGTQVTVITPGDAPNTTMVAR